MADNCLRSLAIVNCGFEAVAVSELKNLGCFDCEEKTGCVTFTVKSFEHLCSVCYSVRGVNRILLLLSKICIVDFEQKLRSDLNDVNFSQFLVDNDSFAVDYVKNAGVDVDGRVFAGCIGELIKEKTGAKVNLSHPDICFTCFINNEFCFVGLDFCGDDLGRRDYRIFLGHEVLRGNVAFGLLQFAGYSPNLILLDPFCRSGAIVIEAALFSSNVSPHFFSKNKFAFTKFKFLNDVDFDRLFSEIDKNVKKFESKIWCFDPLFQHVNASRKNAKIAGVLENIEFSRIEAEWLDLKFDKNTIDRIITFPPQVSKSVNIKKTERIYDWFFRNANQILKKDGLVLIVCLKSSVSLLERFALLHKFVLDKKHVFYQGAEEMTALLYSLQENKNSCN